MQYRVSVPISCGTNILSLCFNHLIFNHLKSLILFEGLKVPNINSLTSSVFCLCTVCIEFIR